jgi:hypothetical protein
MKPPTILIPPQLWRAPPLRPASTRPEAIQDAADRGEQGPAGGFQRTTWDLAAEQGELVKDLEVVVGVAAGELGEQLDGVAQGQVGESWRHQGASASEAAAGLRRSLVMSGSSKAMLRVMAALPRVHALLLGGGHRCGGQEVVVVGYANPRHGL